MKTTEFKNYYNTLTKALESATTCELVDLLNNEYTSAYEAKEIKLTETQAAKCADALAARYFELRKDVTSEMSNKKKNTTPADEVPAHIEAEAEAMAEAPADVNTEDNAPAEVLKGEVINTKDEAEVAEVIDRITEKVDAIGRGYLDIVGDVARLYDLKGWTITGHKNIYELCADKFGMARGTVSNLRKVFERYGDKDTYKLTDEADGLSLRAMLANIASENQAAIADKNGAAESEDGGEATAEAPAKNKKPETICNIEFDILGGEWDVEALAAELKAMMEKAEADLSKDCKVTLTITR